MLTLKYGYPILTADQTRELDASTERDFGLPLAVLMENAGHSVASVALGMEPERVIALVGSGNNGGDALVAARLLADRGVSVLAALARPAGEMSGLAALALRRYEDAGGRCAPAEAVDFDAADLVLDGLLGTGLSGPAREPARGLIEAVNASLATVLSIDVPSGVVSDASSVPECAVEADVTVALGCLKPALVHHPAARWAAIVRLADIGIPHSLLPGGAAQVMSLAAAREMMPRWPADCNKGSRGRLAVVAGSRGMCGAAALTCASAASAGAGLVYLANPEGLTPIFEVKLTETVLRPVQDVGAQRYTAESVEPVLSAIGASDAAVIGPGLGQDPRTAAFLTALLPRVTAPCVLDADALNLMAAHGLNAPGSAVMTPHPGEMARLLGTTVPEVQSDRAAAVEAAARRFGCVVVLKGCHTLVAAPGEPTVANLVDNPALATAGSGDVLCGVIGTLLAQGLSPFEAALAGVRWHGTAGVLAASKWGGTLAASEFLRWLSPAREEMLNDESNDEMLV